MAANTTPDRIVPDGVDPRYRPDLGAHAVADFRYFGKEHLTGEPFAVAALSDEEVWAMWRGGRIEFGPAPAAAVEDAKRRRAELAREAARKGKADKTPTSAPAGS